MYLKRKTLNASAKSSPKVVPQSAKDMSDGSERSPKDYKLESQKNLVSKGGKDAAQGRDRRPNQQSQSENRLIQSSSVFKNCIDEENPYVEESK